MKATTKTSTSLLKKYISEKYGMKVSVKSDKYSGGSSMRISYDLGLKTSHIENDLKRLERGNFNGMIDLYEYKNAAERGIKINGVELEMYDYVFVDREISNEFELKIAQAFFSTFKFSGLEYLQLETVKNLHATNEEMQKFFGVWTVANLMYRYIQHMNFLTQNEADIVRVWFENVEGCLNYEKVKMHYELSNGQIYDTTQTEIKKELKTVEREATIILNDVKMVDYSEKAVAVIGNTYEIKDELKALGGKFNRFLTVDGAKVPGWIFSKGKADEIADILIKYSEQ